MKITCTKVSSTIFSEKKKRRTCIDVGHACPVMIDEQIPNNVRVKDIGGKTCYT